MLILTRLEGESIEITHGGETIRIELGEVRPGPSDPATPRGRRRGRCVLAIDGPRSFRVVRGEIADVPAR